MKSIVYKVKKLQIPDNGRTHQVWYECETKGEGKGGYGCGSAFRGSYKECVAKKRELENGI